MLSPTTLTFSTLVLVVSERPFRTGLWFYLGAVGATLAVGIVAAFVLGDAAAASDPVTPEGWVRVGRRGAAAFILPVGGERNAEAAGPRGGRRDDGPEAQGAAFAADRDRRGGATLANPGGFIPLALKEISELDP